MLKPKSRSTVSLITQQFHEKFKHKINFVNKQGLVCPMFEHRDPNQHNQQNPNKPYPQHPETKQQYDHYTAQRFKQTREASAQRGITVTFENRPNRILSLPRLKSTISTNSAYSTKSTVTVKQGKMTMLMSGLKTASRPRLQLCR